MLSASITLLLPFARGENRRYFQLLSAVKFRLQSLSRSRPLITVTETRDSLLKNT